MADTAPESSRSEQSQLGSGKEFHTAVGFIIGLMLTLVGVKYQGSGTTLFKEHSLIMFFFIMVVLVYAIALLKMTLEAATTTTTTHHQNQNQNQNQNANYSIIPFYYNYIFLISGTVACELLLYVLVTPFWWFLIINSFISIFAEVLRRWQPQIINVPVVLTADEAATTTTTTTTRRRPKLYDRFKQVFSRSPNSSRAAAEQEVANGHNTMWNLFQPLYDQEHYCCLGLNNRMHQCFQHIFYRFNSSASTTDQDEGGSGGGDIQMMCTDINV